MESSVLHLCDHIRLFTKIIALRPIQYQIDTNHLEHIPTKDEIILHECRNQITEYEQRITNGRNWEYYKKVVNPFELVYTQKKYPHFPESICFIKPLSRSYFKMIEILDMISFFQLFPGEQIRTTHVCEGPGGFIEALFDEATKKQRKIQNSVAMTLKSRKTNIPGWKRATYFLQKNKNVKIIFGEDDTGDIMIPENQQFFIDYTTKQECYGKTHIFTADGGFDFSGDYMKQEQMVFPLLLASTKIGLEVLKSGGVFILKLFDFYHKSTTDLLFFLSMHFDEWTLYKPGMSRPCNPEHYFVGKGFTGCTEEEFDLLRLWCSIVDPKQEHTIHGQQLDSLIISEYTPEFIEMLDRVRRKSFFLQTEYLHRVFEMIDQNDDDLIKHYVQQNEKTSYEWCVRFNVPMYENRRHLIEESHNDQQASSLQ
jgi:23S rRNA U2552 (ribose-2'-O)-methylase RlmE/FtsJ